MKTLPLFAGIHGAYFPIPLMRGFCSSSLFFEAEPTARLTDGPAFNFLPHMFARKVCTVHNVQF